MSFDSYNTSVFFLDTKKLLEDPEEFGNDLSDKIDNLLDVADFLADEGDVEQAKYLFEIIAQYDNLYAELLEKGYPLNPELYHDISQYRDNIMSDCYFNAIDAEFSSANECLDNDDYMGFMGSIEKAEKYCREWGDFETENSCTLLKISGYEKLIRVGIETATNKDMDPLSRYEGIRQARCCSEKLGVGENMFWNYVRKNSSISDRDIPGLKIIFYRYERYNNQLHQ